MVPPVQLPVRQVGKNGPWATAIGFGTLGMGIDAYGAKDSDEERLNLLDRAWELGCTNWDTARSYGDSENVIGKWLKLHPERRADIFLATKFGFKISSDGVAIDSSPETCREQVEESLGALRVEYIDLLYVHRADTKTPIEKTIEAMKQLKDRGKVKYLGLSEVSSSTLRRAHAISPISAVQVEYNPWSTEIEGRSGTNLLETCRELGVAVFAYSPLGRGMLTGRFRSIDDLEPGDARRRYERFQPENFAKNIELVDKFNDMARRKGCTSGQLALAWLCAQDELIFVIPGTKSQRYLDENVGAAAVTLSEEEERELRKTVEDAGVYGGRSAIFGSYIDTMPLEE
ncbi:NADP-dependent oxidoreductase domain-containing protein [Coniochaeta sp. 2T2.1]|nr:NADP-dependent oxidoreductase domain-containing protein [Coniochaeta sp. 2T2.1]